MAAPGPRLTGGQGRININRSASASFKKPTSTLRGDDIIRKLTEFMRTHRHAWLALYFVVFIAAFFTIESLTPTEGYWVTDLPLDDKIPFIPQFIIFYVLWYPLFAAVGVPLIIFDGEAFKRYMYFTMASLSLSLLFCVIIPNGQNLRPEDMEITGISTWLLSKIWAADTNTNVFPSMHVIGCIGAVLGAWDSRIFKGWRWVILVFSVLISASTVFVKQHGIIDAVGALAFAVPIFFAVYSRRFLTRKK